jgi:hypothetical protein
MEGKMVPHYLKGHPRSRAHDVRVQMELIIATPTWTKNNQYETPKRTCMHETLLAPVYWNHTPIMLELRSQYGTHSDTRRDPPSSFVLSYVISKLPAATCTHRNTRHEVVC